MSAPGTSTSGEYALSPVAAQLITDALQDLGVIEENETPSASMYAKGKRKLNSLITEWYATGIHVWTEEEAVLFLQQNQVQYLLGGDTTDHCASFFDYAQNSLASGANAGATSLTLASAIDRAKGDQFGVVLNTGAAFWTTLADASSTTSVTLTDALPSAVSAQAFVYAYTTNIVRPLRIPKARRIQWAQPGSYPIETPLTDMMSRQEYMDLPNKQSPGVVTQAFYNPARDQGQLFVWPMPQFATQGLRFTWYRPIQTFSATDNLPDLPVEWQNAIEWNLAKEMALGYSVSVQRLQEVKAMAAEKLEIVQGWDREFQSVYFGVSTDQTARQ